MSPLRRSLLLTVCLLASTALVAVAGAQEETPAAIVRTFTIGAQEDNSKCPDGEGPCWDVPLLVVAPGDQVTVHVDLRSAGVPHDFNLFHPDGAMKVPAKPTTGDIYTLNFTFPANAETINFECTVHPRTMIGKVAIASAVGGHEEEAIPEMGVHFLSYWVGLIAFLILFIVYGATFFLFKYNETPATTDQWDRSGESGTGKRIFSPGMTSIIALLLAAALIGGVIYLAGR